jgi:hypothetical protein
LKIWCLRVERVVVNRGEAGVVVEEKGRRGGSRGEGGVVVEEKGRRGGSRGEGKEGW